MSSALFLYAVGENSPVWQIVAAFMLLCLGVTCVIMPAQTTAMSALPARLYADGSAVWNTFYQVAGAVGTASAISLMSFTVMRQQHSRQQPRHWRRGSMPYSG